MPSSRPQEHTTRPGCSDVDLALLAAGAGDRDAFARFYDATSAHAFGLVLHLVEDRVQSEGVALDSYVEAWRNAPSFDREQGSARTWLMRHVLHHVQVRSHLIGSHTSGDSRPAGDLVHE